MASAAPGPSECPVCHEGFRDPKILPCAHLVCRHCVLAWLQQGGDHSGCPLCRAPILSPPLQGEGDLDSQVDALLSDVATAGVTESEKTLSEDHVCSGCEEAEATQFCLQCSIKLCDACAKIHAKMPLAQNHNTEKLDTLSAEQLAAHRPIFCINHSDKPAELFCSDHQQLICVVCGSSSHRQCSEVRDVGDVAPDIREKMKSLIQRLTDREAVISEQIVGVDREMSDGESKFKAMRAEVKTAFDDLQNALDAERQKLNAEIQAREETFLAERKSFKLDLENLQAALSAHRSTTDRLVASAPDRAILKMMGKLTARLEALESKEVGDKPKSTPGHLLLKSARVDKTKKAVAAIGMLQDSEESDKADPNCLWCGRILEPEGPEFAAIIKVGDRVKRGRGWNHGSTDGPPPGLGTVTGVDADLKQRRVWVRWDWDGSEYCYCMGYNNHYHLKLARSE